MNWSRRNWTALALGVALAALVVLLGVWRLRSTRVRVLVGAVLREDANPNRQVPLPHARIIARGTVEGECESDESGLFRLHLNSEVSPGTELVLNIEHASYQKLTVPVSVSDRIYIVRMVPAAPESRGLSSVAQVPVTSIRVRYAEETSRTVNAGTMVKTFQAVNKGNTPCQRGAPCSPDGRWKAAIGGASFDAGSGNKIRNVRVSCFAGPCPFSKIESEKISSDGQSITVSVSNWSDTVTYLVEAEVFRTVSTDTIQYLYPVIFGRVMDFTLPPFSRGPSIEANVKGEEIVFPLGPALELSWANCGVQTARDQTRVYRCELKPGYRFE